MSNAALAWARDPLMNGHSYMDYNGVTLIRALLFALGLCLFATWLRKCLADNGYAPPPRRKRPAKVAAQPVTGTRIVAGTSVAEAGAADQKTML